MCVLEHEETGANSFITLCSIAREALGITGFATSPSGDCKCNVNGAMMGFFVAVGKLSREVIERRCYVVPPYTVDHEQRQRRRQKTTI